MKLNSISEEKRYTVNLSDNYRLNSYEFAEFLINNLLGFGYKEDNIFNPPLPQVPGFYWKGKRTQEMKMDDRRIVLEANETRAKTDNYGSHEYDTDSTNTNYIRIFYDKNSESDFLSIVRAYLEKRKSETISELARMEKRKSVLQKDLIELEKELSS